MAALLAELARAWPAERQALEAVLPWLLPAAPLLAHFYSYLPPRRWYWLTLLPPLLLAGLGYGWPGGLAGALRLGLPALTLLGGAQALAAAVLGPLILKDKQRAAVPPFTEPRP